MFEETAHQEVKKRMVENEAIKNWREPTGRTYCKARLSRIQENAMASGEKLRECFFRKIQASRSKKGLYYVLCLNSEECWKQSVYPKTIDLRKSKIQV